MNQSPTLFERMPSIIVLVGHAGVGKTNTALGLAFAMADAGHAVTLADADVVNPYFRSSDYALGLRDAGVHVIAPVSAGTTLDTPSLTGELDAAIEKAAASNSSHLIVDVGGDDDGATAIGRWGTQLSGVGAFVAYVVNAFREPGNDNTRTRNAIAYLRAIESAGHLRATGVLNTSNLGQTTTAADVAAGRAFARSVADAVQLPLTATVVPAVTAAAVAATLPRNRDGMEPLVAMDKHVMLPWEANVTTTDTSGARPRLARLL